MTPDEIEFRTNFLPAERLQALVGRLVSEGREGKFLGADVPDDMKAEIAFRTETLGRKIDAQIPLSDMEKSMLFVAVSSAFHDQLSVLFLDESERDAILKSEDEGRTKKVHDIAHEIQDTIRNR